MRRHEFDGGKNRDAQGEACNRQATLRCRRRAERRRGGGRGHRRPVSAAEWRAKGGGEGVRRARVRCAPQVWIW